LVSYDTTYEPAIPVTRVRITDTFRSQTLGPLDVIIDSGADCSSIPESAIGSWLRFDRETGRALDYNGNTLKQRFIRIVRARVEILNDRGEVLLVREHLDLRLLVLQEEALLGRDVLNHLVCELNGPGLRGELR